MRVYNVKKMISRLAEAGLKGDKMLLDADAKAIFGEDAYAITVKDDVIRVVTNHGKVLFDYVKASGVEKSKFIHKVFGLKTAKDAIKELVASFHKMTFSELKTKFDAADDHKRDLIKSLRSNMVLFAADKTYEDVMLNFGRN